MAALIICAPGDWHACALTWALRPYGRSTILWHPAPPWVSPGGVRFDSASVDYRFAGDGGALDPSSVDAVWLRRWPSPTFPSDFSDSDRTASRNELLAYHRGVLELLPSDILWANRPESGRSANKLKQLAAAVSVGLSIPETLVTDDSTQAREFVASQPDGAVVYKPFHTFHFERACNEVYSSATTPVTAADLDDPEALAWSPGIFQKFVPKAHELRVSIFGRTCVTARIFDQDPIDWRTRQFDMKVAPGALPGAVEDKLHALMDELGLTMGMADLIVTPDGDHVFLEVNEQGQFLWVEQMCPELPLLDTCARFFASGDPRFRAEVNPAPASRYARFIREQGARALNQRHAFIDKGGIVPSSLLKDHDDPGPDL